MVAAHRGLSQLKHVLHRLLAPRHSPCALSNLFLDPIIDFYPKIKNDKIDLEAVFTKVFARLNPAKVRPRALSIKLQIVLPSIQMSKNRKSLKEKKTDSSLKLVRNGGSDRTRTCDPRLIKAVL